MRDVTSRHITPTDGPRADRRHRDTADAGRSPFERDRDRIIYSDAFRRLGGVTQVVSPVEGHIHHNRLTHTIKVAQVARRLGERLLAGGGAAGTGGDVRDLPAVPLDAAVTETAALAHDLGHPPFGHIGEVELQRLVEPYAPRDSFEGNAQSFRIVTKVSRSKEMFPGLNLTRATLLAILKYPWPYDPADAKASLKWGAYLTEADDFRFAKGLAPDAPLPAAGEPQSVEAHVMDWADDITYAVHDIEDLFRAGLIPLDRFGRDDEARADFSLWVAERWASHGRHVATSDVEDAFTEILALHPIREPFEGTSSERAKLRSWTSVLIRRYVHNTGLVPPDGGGEGGTGSGWRLEVPARMRLEVDLLKELTWRYVLEKPQLASLRHGHKAVIRGLFEIYMDAADPARPHVVTGLLPARVREEVTELAAAVARGDDIDDAGAGGGEGAWRARLVCDALCSMTDDEATRMHARLTGHTMGSVFDPIL